MSEVLAGSTAGVRSRSWRMRASTRRIVLVTHIIAGGGWLGLDAAFVVLVTTGMLSDDTATSAACYQAARVVAIWPMLTAGLLSLLTGIVLGLGSRYGLVTYWWVAVKLAINLLYLTLIVIGLGPEVRRVAAAGRDLATDPKVDVSIGQLGFPLVIGPALLLTAMLLSVYKPWGRLRRDRHQPRETPPAGP